MSSINKPEFFQVYTGETRALPLRTTNQDGTPFALTGYVEVQARFKKADGGVLIKSSIPVAEVVKFSFSQSGLLFDVSGPGKFIQLFNYPNIGHYFWFRVTDGSNTQVDPSLVGNAHRVDILTTDTASQIASKFYTAVSLVSSFTATNTVPVEVIVTCSTPGTLLSHASANACTRTIVAVGLDAGVVVTNAALGRLTVTLTKDESSQLLVGERQSFALVITLPYGVRKCNFRNALTVERQAI